MIDKKEVFIHIGYPKTATTTLQNHFFKNLNGFDLIGQPLTRENSDMQKFIHKITDSEALEYDEEKIKEELNHFLTDNKNIIISEESFSTGSSLSGRVDRVQIAKRLKSLFHNAKIILVLREQKSIVKSYYLQKKKIDEYFEMTFNEWFEYNKNNLHKENVFQYFNYYEIVGVYEELFGKDNIKLLCFEEFKTDKNIFLNNLLKFCGLSKLDIEKHISSLDHKHDNQTVTKELIRLKKLNKKFSFFKKIIPQKIKNLITKKAKYGEKLEVLLSEDQINFINSLYSDSNYNLMTSYKLQLYKYNYALEKQNV